MMKIEKADKQISFPKPKLGILYTSTEFIECLIEDVDSEDRRLVIKQLINMKLIPINYFCVVLIYIQKYRKGFSSP